jgi:hypothetical protein
MEPAFYLIGSYPALFRSSIVLTQKDEEKGELVVNSV